MLQSIQIKLKGSKWKFLGKWFEGELMKTMKGAKIQVPSYASILKMTKYHIQNNFIPPGHCHITQSDVTFHYKIKILTIMAQSQPKVVIFSFSC